MDEDMDHPLWRCLSPESADPVDVAPTMVQLRAVARRTAAYRVREAVAALPEGAAVLIATDRGGPHALIRAAVRRTRPASPLVSVRALRRAAVEAGIAVRDVYTVWPGLHAPRIAWPHRDRRIRRWAQHTGVLGGGGQLLWLRALLRSRALAPVVGLLASSVVIVGHKRGSA